MRDNNIIQDAINSIKILKYEIKELKIENEKLRALCDTYKTCYQAKHNDIDGKLFKYRQTLQEIKAIAKAEYYAVEPDARYIVDKILELITKAESEKQTNEK